MPGLFICHLNGDDRTEYGEPEIRITWKQHLERSHTSKFLNLVWFTDLKFLNVNATQLIGTSNPPHSCDAALQQ